MLGYGRGKAKLTNKNANKEVTAEPNELKTEPKKEKPEKRENKKWKNKSPESNSPVEIKERKYFN